MTLGRQDPEPRAALAGRRFERQLLERVVRGAAEGAPGAVLLHGEAGVGKTRLVADVTQQAQANGFHLLWGQCLHFGAASSPWLPIASAFDSWLTSAADDEREALVAEVPTITDLLPRTPGGTTDADSARLLATVDAAVTALTDQRPTVLVVDDLQWADVTSLDVLAYLIAGPRHRPLAVVLSFRDEGVPEGHSLHGWLADMLRMPTVTDVPLERFTADETGDQLSALLGGRPTAALVAAVQRRSAGNAYFNELLVRGLDPHAEELPADLPHLLRVAVLAKWHALDEATRNVVRIVSAAGRPLSAAYLASLTGRLGLPDAEVRHALTEADTNGVLERNRNGEIWFRHPLLAEVLGERALPHEVRRVHAAIVDVLRDDTIPDTRRLADLALHCARAGMPDEALDYALSAAAEAAKLQVYPEEASLRSLAAELWHRASPDVRDAHGSEAALLASVAYCARRAGDLGQAVRAIEQAADVVDEEAEPLTAAAILTLRPRLRQLNGDPRGYEDTDLRRAVELSSVEPTSPEHARALGELAELLGWTGMTEEAREVGDAAVAVARGCGDASTLSWVVGQRSFAYLGTERGDGDAEECYRVAVEAGEPEYVGLACVVRCNALELQGRYAECAEVYLEGCEVTARQGLTGLSRVLGTYAALCLLPLGRFAQARDVIRRVLASRPSGSHAVQARAVALTLALREGDLDAARIHLERITELSPHFEEAVGLYGPSVLADYLTTTGRPEEALRMLIETVAIHARAESRYGDEMLANGAMAAAAWAVDLRDQGRGAEAPAALLEELVAARSEVGLAPFERTETDPMQAAHRDLFEAYSARCRGAESADLWAAAVSTCDEAGMIYDATLARLRLTQSLLSEGGSRSRPAAVLRVAHESADRMGVAPLRQEIEDLARTARLSLAQVREVAGSSDLLSKREREVLSHLVAGRSYSEIARALFISEKTVSAHVSNLLRKTGTANRVEAAAWARRNTTAPAEPSEPVEPVE